MNRIAIVPTLFTLGNGVCGFAALTFAARIPRVTVGSGVDFGAQEINWLWWSGLMILFAMVFDMLDGRVARMARWTSDFGAQLDSLCDAISFGVAPAFLLLKLCSDSARLELNAVWMKLLWIVAVLYVMCAILRLARFNVENDHTPESHLWFKGLPSPAAAASAAILRREVRENPLAGILSDLNIDPYRLEQTIDVGLPIATIALAFLMVSHVRYPHLVNQLLRGRKSFAHLVTLLFAVVTIVVVREAAMPLLVWGFALGTPVVAMLTALRHRPPATDTDAAADAASPAQT
jgi:CDP-diacylglycerol--serine O-phosphatidyltransferase